MLFSKDTNLEMVCFSHSERKRNSFLIKDWFDTLDFRIIWTDQYNFNIIRSGWLGMRVKYMWVTFQNTFLLGTIMVQVSHNNLYKWTLKALWLYITYQFNNNRFAQFQTIKFLCINFIIFCTCTYYLIN